MLKIGVLYGGRSGEHNVSLCSAASVVRNLNRDKYEVIAIGIDRDGKWYVQDSPEIVEDKDFGKILKISKTGSWFVNHFNNDNKLYLYELESKKKVYVDVVMPIVHGTFCEDGTLQGLLELAMVPYVGADVVGSSIAMDKDVSKRLLKQGGVEVVPWVTVTKGEWKSDKSDILSKILSLSLPLFVKPSSTGSSVGIKKVKAAEDLDSAVEYSFQYDTKILVEKAIDCREIECSVLGNRQPEASIPGEIIPEHEFYSYEAKYIDPEGARLQIPAEIDDDLVSRIRETAVKAYKILCCSGMARVDFFLEKNGKKYYLNEINTIPGFTRISMYPKLWEKTGLKYSELLDKLIELSLERNSEKRTIKTEL